jgi:hypothetical protein
MAQMGKHWPGQPGDDPHAVAGQVAAILVRLGVTKLQGE